MLRYFKKKKIKFLLSVTYPPPPPPPGVTLFFAISSEKIHLRKNVVATAAIQREQQE